MNKYTKGYLASGLILLLNTQNSHADLDTILDKATEKLVQSVTEYALKSSDKSTFCATGGDITRGEFSIGSFDGLLCSHRMWASLAMSQCWDNKSYRNGKLWQDSKCGQNAKRALGSVWGNKQEANKLFIDRLKENTGNTKRFGCQIANKFAATGALALTGGMIPIPKQLTTICSAKKK